ncbi:MAG: hypothetical protein ABFS56_17700 [Pseudomonadota bacterium]
MRENASLGWTDSKRTENLIFTRRSRVAAKGIVAAVIDHGTTLAASFLSRADKNGTTSAFAVVNSGTVAGGIIVKDDVIERHGALFGEQCPAAMAADWTSARPKSILDSYHTLAGDMFIRKTKPAVSIFQSTH